MEEYEFTEREIAVALLCYAIREKGCDCNKQNGVTVQVGRKDGGLVAVITVEDQSLH